MTFIFTVLFFTAEAPYLSGGKACGTVVIAIVPIPEEHRLGTEVAGSSRVAGSPGA